MTISDKKSRVHRCCIEREDRFPENGERGYEKVEIELALQKQNAEGSPSERPIWARRAEFILAAIGFAVGLGNIWRFPWLLMKNGGGAFLIPYFIMLILVGIPIFIMELCIGQRNQVAPLQLWMKLSNFSSGLGVSQLVRIIFGQTVFLTILSWSFYYFFASFQSPLPWSSCKRAESHPAILENNQTLCDKLGPPLYYWYERVMRLSDSFGSDLEINWRMSLSILATGTVVALCLIRGIKSAGKVVYFTVTFPYLVLLIFLIRGVTLQGAGDGLRFLFKIDFSRLADSTVWFEAAAQIFYSLSLAAGGMVTYASYNPKRQDFFVDAITISVINSVTSLTAGLAVFSLLGHRAHLMTEQCKDRKSEVLNQISVIVNSTLNNRYNTSGMNTLMYQRLEGELHRNVSQGFDVPVCGIDKVLESTPPGTGLVYIALTEVINQLPGATVFSLLFFLMLITIGLDSAFGGIECVISCIFDSNKFKNVRQEIIVVSFVGFLTLIAQVFATRSGEYFLQLLNTYTIDLTLVSFALMEIITVMYFYGMQRFCDDIKEMTGRTVNYFLKFTLLFVSPGILLVLLASTIINYANGALGMYQRWEKYKGKLTKTHYPLGAVAVGWISLLGILLVLPGVPLYFYLTRIKKNRDDRMLEEKQ